MDSPFDVLALDADADEDEIEQAYRRRVKEAHPDQGGSVEQFQRVRTAYERLKAGYQETAVAESDAGNPAADSGPRTDGAAAADSTATTDGAATTDSTASDGRAENGNRYASISSQVTYLNYDVLADFGWQTDDEDLFRKAAAADLDEVDYGQFRVSAGESLLEAAEDRGFAWPFACRGGACANCAILLLEGELSMPVSHVLPAKLMERGFRLSCNGMPITDELKVIYNVKHMPELDDLLLPPRPFEQAYPDD